jgi:N-acetylmuramoyl-L-alanine amidase
MVVGVGCLLPKPEKVFHFWIIPLQYGDITKRKQKRGSVQRRQAANSAISDLPIMRFLWRNVLLLTFLALAISGMLSVYYYFSPAGGTAEVVAAGSLAGGLSAPLTKPKPAVPVGQRLAQSPGPLRIGIISGHRGNDSGAVCADGLTEAEVVEAIAMRVVSALEARRIRADLLDEFDPRLNGYTATALVSIHADSCDFVNDMATGYKVAGSSYTDSTRLSICVEEAYTRETQLPYHANTITPHMTDYHAFREIAPGVPAIIIETGFLNLDREFLTQRPDVAAQAISNGILCYVGEVQGGAR